MAVLGKRKAPEPIISTEDAQEIFRRHFEAQFLPLPEAERKAREKEEEDDDSEDGSDGSEDEGGEWGGLSNDDEGSDDEDDDDDELDEDDDDDDSPTVEVVDHSGSQAPKISTMSKRELKAFMSSRPPDPTSTSSSKPTPQPSSKSSSSALPEDAPSLLAQDLELRRLIAESHLLQTNKPTSLSAILSSSSSAAQSEPKAFAAGRVRQKALDLRIQALGSKTSILKQEKMPMHMRKGINAAAVERETKRRREAKESGVILERETGKKKKRERRTGGGGGGFGPAVGRMRGAELRISERDVKKIEGARDTFGRKGKR
ncbi:uncharacterized protein TRIREDRAFT_120767 [Trichoderma reesei QM6a]|uniref:Protein FAF1 n=2 Tax=Hypocrea jecorina TaxID=51453 RepID=G0RD74_HYPJQ|nr:uncharacterized protein TRIREDRAFT_120767 [Trichoderma reesei QM6a]EGR50693.1 hypothetical protein TRIREDRAFT_120767 [Trichoderma reesei QM6a]ETS05535.1 hypothetical protein M419DRAFT_95637 [Trichoderma reesei RUT C-30]